MTHYVLPETDARIDYDKKVKGLYVAVAGVGALKDSGEATVRRTVTVNEDPVVNLDFDEANNLLGVEILLP